MSKQAAQFRTTLKLILGAGSFFPAYFAWEWYENKRRIREYVKLVGDTCYMDIAIGNRYAGRLLLGLYSDKVPLTCENFVQLCKGFTVKDKMIGYRNTYMHMIKPGVAVGGGDVIAGTGKGRGMSIYGESFPDENFEMAFTREGDLAMANVGKNTNSSLFMITLSHQNKFEGHHVVFGTVLKGMKIVREMGELGTKVGRPAMPIRILQCGVVEDGVELPPPPLEFLPPSGPLISEDEFRAVNAEKPGTAQPS